jgi:hypothetical protein
LPDAGDPHTTIRIGLVIIISPKPKKVADSTVASRHVEFLALPEVRRQTVL